MPIEVIDSRSKFDEMIKGNKVVIIDFYATWCGPCRMISPVFEKLSEDYPGIIFAKVDVDEVLDVSQKCGVRSMPTFISFVNGERHATTSGANLTKLKELVEKANSL